VRDVSAIAVMIARNSAMIIRITNSWMITFDDPRKPPSAAAIPVPSTMPVASIPECPRTPWNEKGIRKKNTMHSRPE